MHLNIVYDIFPLFLHGSYLLVCITEKIILVIGC